MGGSGETENDAVKRAHSMMTRSMSKSMSKPKAKAKRRVTKTGGISPPKLYKITWDGGECYSSLPPEEYFGCRKAVEDFYSNPPCKNDPTHDKSQSDYLCREYFPIIQEARNEIADYVLVEPMAVKLIMFYGCWAHLNFKAKHKDAEDSTAAVYFAELDFPNKEVTVFSKLDIDFSADTSAYKFCTICHRDPKVDRRSGISGKGCVYHPPDVKLRLR